MANLGDLIALNFPTRSTSSGSSGGTTFRGSSAQRNVVDPMLNPAYKALMGQMDTHNEVARAAALANLANIYGPSDTDKRNAARMEMEKHKSAMANEAMARRLQQSEFEASEIKNEVTKINEAIRIIGSASDQRSWDRAIATAERAGLNVSAFKGVPFSVNLRDRMLGTMVSEKDKLAAELEKRRQDIELKVAELGLKGKELETEGATRVAEIEAAGGRGKGAMTEYQEAMLAFNRNKAGVSKENQDEKIELERQKRNDKMMADTSETIDNLSSAIDSYNIADGVLSQAISMAVKLKSMNRLTNPLDYPAGLKTLGNFMTGQALTAIRAASKNGASGYGQVTTKELPIIASQAGQPDYFTSMLDGDYKQQSFATLIDVLQKSIEQNKINIEKSQVKAQELKNRLSGIESFSTIGSGSNTVEKPKNDFRMPSKNTSGWAILRGNN